MKRLVLIIVCLVGIAVFFSCKKEKSGDAVQPWQFSFILIDSLGNKLFPEPPPGFGSTPFDPKQSYWIDGTGKTKKVSLKGTASLGLIFVMSNSIDLLKLDTNYLNNNFISLEIYLTPGVSPIHFKVVNPVNTPHIGDYLIWNGDTLDHYLGAGTPEIIYP